MLIDELGTYKQQTEKLFQSKDQLIKDTIEEMSEAKNQLTKAKENLIRSEETKIQLRTTLNDLVMAGETDRKKNDQVEMDLRNAVTQQSADLMELNCKHQRMIEQKELTIKKLVDAAREDMRTAAECIDGLTKQINMLTKEEDQLMAELNIRDKNLCMLRARAVELEDLLMVNMKSYASEKSCLEAQAPSQDAENPIYSMELGRGDNYPQSCSQCSTDESQPCSSQWSVDNKQSYRLSRSSENITTDNDVQPCLLSIMNVEDDNQNISSENYQTGSSKYWDVTELIKKYQFENN